MNSTITEAEAAKITAWLDTHNLPSGLGDEESACSIAAINLALTGRLTDDIPDCMSPAIGRWIITIQDAMPYSLRNSAAWKRLLPLAAGTGRALEGERAAIALDWMWTVVLPQLQPLADANGFGPEWLRMTTERTADAASAAVHAAYAAVHAASAAYAAVHAASAAARAASAAYAAVHAASAAARAAAFWAAVDPCACLARMIAATADKEASE